MACTYSIQTPTWCTFNARNAMRFGGWTRATGSAGVLGIPTSPRSGQLSQHNQTFLTDRVDRVEFVTRSTMSPGPWRALLDGIDVEGQVRFSLVPVRHRGVVVAALVGMPVFDANPD
jgi:hypothetical protein